MTTETESPPTRPAIGWHWAWLVLIVVWPIVAHGCHGGDHDDELAAPPEARREESHRLAPPPVGPIMPLYARTLRSNRSPRS